LKKNPSTQVLNLMVKINDEAEFDDPNAVKVVLDPKGDALYFSREPIPSKKKGHTGPRYKQLGMIGFRRDYLLRYVALPPTPLEVAESVDMMRVL
ncbi:MAG: 3-deoxy-manno-octulosonate cytidylyltransferase, partial [Bdellovibrionota bacterium]